MSPWLESFLVVLLALGGAALGYGFSRLRKPYWLIGYVLPLVVILIYGLARQRPQVAFVAPISWMMLGRTQFAVIGFLSSMILTTPLSRLRHRRERVVVGFLMAVIVSMMSVWPFLAPAFNRDYLAQLKTNIDGNGICRQSNDYNCGPAAAVTALRKLGFPAEEGQIAILAHTSTAVGTPADMLAQALQDNYGKDGLVAEYRIFNSVSQLKTAGITLAVIKYTFMIDHFVTVLEVNDKEVILGDPLDGLRTVSIQDFERQWRYVGVVLRRSPH